MSWKNILLTLHIIALPCGSFAASNGTSSGQSILDPLSARPAALGEATHAGENDIANLKYNPATLSSLESSQVSLLYQKGLVEDSNGQLSYGRPTRHGGLGLALGTYDGGSISIFDGANDRTVKSKQDFMGTFGYAHKFSALSIGGALKVISSEIAETKKATAYAIDLGLHTKLTSRIALGVAIQNIGTALKYDKESNKLPRIARLGTSVALLQNNVPTNLYLDAPYFMNEKELRPSGGLEISVGPLVIRGGYASKNELQSFTFGAGFMIGNLSLDYSYGLADELDATHKTSITFKFGADQSVRNVKTNISSKSTVTSTSNLKTHHNRIYLVQAGDTLRSIANTMYGDSSAWKRIKFANSNVLHNKETLEMGQRIVLP